MNRKKLVRLLDLPDEYEVLLVLALGVPAEEVVVEALPSGGKIEYWRTSDGTHHVPSAAWTRSSSVATRKLKSKRNIGYRMNRKKKFSKISSKEKALTIAGWLDDKQGGNIVIMDVTGMSSVTDITLVVSARGVKHAKALADHVLEMASENNIEFLRMEGHQVGEWVLLDLNDVLVHVFLEELREFYNLEGMWAEAPRLDRAQ